MVLPRLIHPVPITIEQIDRSTTVYDDDFREEVQRVERGAPVTVSGQVSWEIDKRFRSSLGGAIEDSEGYVLFRFVDLTTAGVTLKREDRFTSLGNYACDVFVTALQPIGHYQDQGGPAMIRAFFKSQQEDSKTP